MNSNISPNTGAKLSVSVVLLPKLITTDFPTDETIAVVIDTLRFTTTAATALAAGAESILVISDIEGARAAAKRLGTESRLCGERECRTIPGFHFGNSPAEYTAASVSGRELIFSTTNGTLAVEAVHAAGQVWLASLVNRSAVCDAVHLASNSSRGIVIVCAGTDGAVALEDVLTAGAMIDYWIARGINVATENDGAIIAREIWLSIRGDASTNDALSVSLARPLQLAAGGLNLIESGFASDLVLAAQIDSLNCAPQRIATAPAVFADGSLKQA